MDRRYIIIILLWVSLTSAAQDSVSVHRHAEDSTDIFFRHLQLSEITVTGVTGDMKQKHASAPVSIVRPEDLRATSATNIIDAISHQPGVSQITTGVGISKPVIRGLGYNRVVVVGDGVRQEGQQWGDEHGIEVDGSSVHSVEILKGPASLMYGSDAMAGVVIMRNEPLPIEGSLRGTAGVEYQTNNGLLGYTVALAGNQSGFVWDGRFSGKMAHAYNNSYDGYVPGSQYREMAGRLMLGLNKHWGHTWLTWTPYHSTPSIIEGRRDSVTGELLRDSEFTDHGYGKTLPFQQVRHHKLVWDNSLNLTSGYLKAIVGYQLNRRQEFEESADECELHFKLHTLTYDLRYLTHERNGWKVSAGLGGMFQSSRNEGEEYLIPDYRLVDVGVFATASKSIERWTFNGGLRYDHRSMHGDALEEDGSLRFADFSRHFNGLTGSVGAVWNISDHWNLRANLARGFRTPNMSELASNGVHEGSLRYEIGSQGLRAEYSLQADLGIDFTSKYISAQVALFANRITDYIFTHRLAKEIEPGYLTYEYTQGDARLLGFEAGFDLHPIHSLHFANSFSYVDARLLHQSEDRTYLPFTPAPRLNSELKWEITHHSHPTLRHHHTAADNGKYAHRFLSLNNMYLAAGIECYLRQDHIYSADETETATPAYTLLNLSAGTDIQIRGKKVAELYLSANNLLNKAYQNHLSRLKYADVNVVTGRRGVYNMGRNITIKLIVPMEL